MNVLRGPNQAPLTPLQGRTVAVLGFGNQGHAHALNLRDSQVRVIIGSRDDSPGGRRAAELGFEVRPVSKAAAVGDLVILAVADHVHGEIYVRDLRDSLRPGATLGFLHGLSIRYGLIQPRADLGIVLVAPKGPGVLLRQLYERGLGLPCLLAVHQESTGHDAESLALAWANGIGATRAAIIRTSFADETESDLFGEQAVLCGGLSELILAAFQTLVDAGYPPELAYLECCHEVKQIADLIYERGLAGMRQSISGTAEFGAYRAGSRLIDDGVRERMRELLAAIRGDAFIKALRDDAGRGFAWLQQQRRAGESHPIEAAGCTVRSFMPWLSQSQAQADR
jgi:ketol-acid reductoisomerase